jgi:acyl-CoA thioesterase
MMDLTKPPAADSMQATLGQQRILTFEPGRAVIEYRCGMHMCHSGGVAQGGFVAGWIDAAMSHAVMAQSGFDFTPMTLEMKISYFAPKAGSNPARAAAGSPKAGCSTAKARCWPRAARRSGWWR